MSRRRSWEDEIAAAVVCERYGLTESELDDIIDRGSLEFRKGVVWALLAVERAFGRALPPGVAAVIRDAAQGYFDGRSVETQAVVCWALAWIEWRDEYIVPPEFVGAVEAMDAIFPEIDWRLCALTWTWKTS